MYSNPPPRPPGPPLFGPWHCVGVCALALGLVAYGLSIFFHIYAQRGLGAARTSAYYAVAPFIGVALSMLLCAERPGVSFFIALAVMAAGAYFASVDPA